MAGAEPLLSSYLHAKGAMLGLPVSGTFELTARCNFSCPMCYVHLKNAQPENELTAAQWLDLARQAKDQGMLFVLLTGGEPFLRKDFFEIYDGMRAMGLMISINSNGSLINGEILQKLVENPPIRINVSLYGGCAEIYQNMCGQNAYTSVVENIRALKSAGIDVRLNYSITPYNRQDMEKIFHISREMDVHIKASSYMYPPARLDCHDCCTRLTAAESAACAVEWDRLRLSPELFDQRCKAAVSTECAVEFEDGVGCRAGVTSFWVTWDGRMLPCGMMNRPSVDVLSRGFISSWQQIREEANSIRMPKSCLTCVNRPMCSVCAAVCLSETGEFDVVPEYVCKRTEEMLRLMRKD